MRNIFRQKVLERTSAFKNFHAKTGGAVGDFLGTFEGEMLSNEINYPVLIERVTCPQ
jgi:hypothetical protein